MTLTARFGRGGVLGPTRLADERRLIASTTLHVMGIALTFVAAGMALTTIVERFSTDIDTAALFVSTAICGGLGLFLWRSTKVGSVRSREVFAAVGFTWLVVTLVGAAPYFLAGMFDSHGMGLSEQIVNSIFESASGFSCTGSTALVDFADQGRGLMMYRQATQWYGGMGIVVLAVSVLPFLGVGGLDLITAEAPVASSDKLAPRVSETARQLWAIYLVYTIAVIVVLFAIPGPSFYDAVAHALSTTSTGGFSPNADSIGHYDSVAVELAIIAGMLYGGVNFSLHWRAARGDLSAYRRDPEFRGYVTAITVAIVFVVSVLWLRDPNFSLLRALRAGAFNVVSLGTSTGFGNARGSGSAGDFVHWASAAQIVLLMLFLVGASTGSTSGGIKVMRVQVLFAHTIRTIRRTQQPRAVLPVKHGKYAVAEDIVSRMAGFLLLYVLLIAVGVVLLTGLGGDLETSIGSIIGALGNMGPGLGEAGPTASFSDAFSQPARVVLSAYMLIGRLEIFPLLLMFAAPYRAIREALPQSAPIR